VNRVSAGTSCSLVVGGVSRRNRGQRRWRGWSITISVVWCGAEAFLHSLAFPRAARIFAALARPTPEVERLRDAAADLATLLALLLEGRQRQALGPSGDRPG
jgi:hypothetical protein